MHWTEIAEREAGDVVILDLRGQMTLADEEALLFGRVAALADHGRRQILLNLRAVPYIDSVGIGEIVRSHVRLTRAGGLLTLCEVAPRIMEVLDATRLTTVLALYGSEDEALNAFSRP